MLVIPMARLLANLAIAIDTDGWLNGVVANLYSNDYVPTLESETADFTECAFTGYDDDKAVVWGTPYISDGDAAEVASGTLQWTCTGASSEFAYGIFLKDAGGDLVYAERFDSPIAFVGSGDAAVCTLIYSDANQAA